MTRLADRRVQLVAWAITTRVAVLATAAGMHWAKGPRGLFAKSAFSHTFGILGSWDGVWYRTVATHGYLLIPGRQSDPAFFPLYPILLRGAHVIGLRNLAAGIVISNLAFVAAMVALYELGRVVVDEDLAWRAAMLAAAFPMGFVYSMAYPESVVLALLAFALTFAIRGRWLASAAAGSLAALGRPEAVLFALPIAALAYRRWRALAPQERAEALGAVVAPAASAAAFPLYLEWTIHNVYAWSWAERSWGRSFKVDGIVHAFTGLPKLIGENHWLIRDVAFAAICVLLLALARRAGVGWAWIAAGALIVVLPLTSGSFVSDARFGLLAIPAYWGLATLTRRRAVFVGTLALSLALLVAGTLTIPWIYP